MSRSFDKILFGPTDHHALERTDATHRGVVIEDPLLAGSRMDMAVGALNGRRPVLARKPPRGKVARGCPRVRKLRLTYGRQVFHMIRSADCVAVKL